jgi:ubiquitin-like domain-containing CTD phosphatase 1
MEPEGHHFICKFKSEEIIVELEQNSTILHLKRKLHEITNVPTEGQKLMGMKYKPGFSGDEVEIGNLICKKKGKYSIIMLTGVPISQVVVQPEVIVDVVDDLDWDSWPCEEEISDMKERKAKLENSIAIANINLMNELDPNKKLIVLDLDQTLFDFSSRSQTPSPAHTIRPGLTEFLTACWKYYNIVIWSATAWNWVEIKLTELGLLFHHGFKIAFVLDKTTMFNVKSTRQNKLTSHSVKPLQLIWRKYPMFSEKNTIHVDDLSRNFVMNLKNGLKIKAYRYSAQAAREDRELYFCAKYITAIASLDDLSKKDHTNWRNEVDKD